MMKKFLRLFFMVIVTVCMLQAEVLAKGAEYDFSMSKTEEQVVDEMIEKRTQALVNGDMKRYKEIDDQLYGKHQLEHISAEQIDEVTQGHIYNKMMTYSDISYNNNVRFEKIYGTKTRNNKKYKYMKIYATPTSEGILYKSGATTIQNSNNYKASVLKLLNIGASAVGGAMSNTFGKAKTVYDMLSTMSGISSVSTINNIKANYTWNVAEICTFVYFENQNAPGTWIIKGRYTRATASVSVAIPTLKIDGRNVSTNIQTKTYDARLSPENYGSIIKPLECYINGGFYETHIRKVNIIGLGGSIVTSVSLYNPEQPFNLY